jgi:CrcB protein
MNQWLAIGVGGAVGSMLRFALINGTHLFAPKTFPYGTLVVNVLGSLAIGVLYILFEDRFIDNDVWRAALIVGVLGGFTTFSAFSMDTFNLMESGHNLAAVLYGTLSVGLCLVATWIGVVLARQYLN